MGLLFLLNGKEPALAAAEAASALYPLDWWTRVPAVTGTSPVAFFPDARKAPSGLGLSRFAMRVLVVSDGPGDGEVADAVRSVDWRRILKVSSWRVRLTRVENATGLSERELAGLILSRAPTARVDLSDPKMTVDIVRTPQRAYIGVRVWENTEQWQDRRAHLWTSPHPTALHPTVARALARIACSPRVHDPCCGAGGLLIEAGLLGLRMSGADIDPSMLARARVNARRFGLRPELRVADATEWMPRAGAVLTDLPYGRSTRSVPVGDLARAMLARAARGGIRRAVIGSPVELPVIPGWVVRARMESYVHRSLTRRFTVLENLGTRMPSSPARAARRTRGGSPKGADAPRRGSRRTP